MEIRLQDRSSADYATRRDSKSELLRLLLVPIAGLFLLCALLVLGMLELSRSAQWVDHTDRVIAAANRLQEIMMDEETGAGAFLTSHDPITLQPWVKGSEQIQAQFDLLATLVNDNPGQRQALRSIREEHESWHRDVGAQVSSAARIAAGRIAAGAEHPVFAQAGMDSMRGKTDSFLATEEGLRRERAERSRRDSRLIPWAAAALSLLSGLAVARWLFRRLSVWNTLHERQHETIEAELSALTIESSRLAAIVDNVPLGLVFSNATGRVLGGNKQAEAIFRHTVYLSAGVEEFGAWVSYHPDGRRVEAHEYPVSRTLADGAVHSGEYLYQRGDGTHGWVQFTSAPLRAKDGSITGTVTATLDIDGRKRAEEALMRNEKLAAVGRLASSIAHEINNPLESITNILYILQGMTEGAVLDYVNTAERELRRAAGVTNQALRFYRQSTSPCAITCQDLIGDALLLYQGKLVNSKIKVEMRKRAESPIVCFEGEIRQVLASLIGNAIDAMHRYGGRLLLRSREATNLKTGHRELVLTVADTGVGMSQETVMRAFDAFYTTKGIGGTGLGLAISKDIIDRHHGRIVFRTTQRRDRSGTVFSIVLPFEQ